MTENLVEGLSKQIERISGTRERYESLRNLPGVAVGPVIAMMTASLSIAQKAMASGDIESMMIAYKDLAEYE
jgi:hypothetical protein